MLHSFSMYNIYIGPKHGLFILYLLIKIQTPVVAETIFDYQ
jgi:hypothetical protein